MTRRHGDDFAVSPCRSFPPSPCLTNSVSCLFHRRRGRVIGLVEVEDARAHRGRGDDCVPVAGAVDRERGRGAAAGDQLALHGCDGPQRLVSLAEGHIEAII